MEQHKKENCIGCIKLDILALCEDNEILKQTIQEYFEQEHKV